MVLLSVPPSSVVLQTVSNGFGMHWPWSPHCPDSPSRSTPHDCPHPQLSQFEPPQSTSPSSPFLSPSSQVITSTQAPSSQTSLGEHSTLAQGEISGEMSEV